MKSYEVECYGTVDPEDVLDSLSISEIQAYLITRKTISPNEKDNSKEIKLTKEEVDNLLYAVVSSYCPPNLATDRKSIEDAFDRMKQEYLENY